VDTALSAARGYIAVQLGFKLVADVLLLGLVFFMQPCSVGAVNHMLTSVWGINLLSTVTAWIAFFLDDADNLVPNIVFVVASVVWVLARSLHLRSLLLKDGGTDAPEQRTDIASVSV